MNRYEDEINPLSVRPRRDHPDGSPAAGSLLRPGYKKTPTGWNTKEQKKRLKQHRKSRPNYTTEYFGGRPVPVTEIHQYAK